MSIGANIAPQNAHDIPIENNISCPIEYNAPMNTPSVPTAIL